MQKRLKVWCLLTSAIFVTVLLLLPLKVAANHYLGGHPWPNLAAISLRNVMSLLGGLSLLSGLVALFVVLANWIWPDKFPLRARFGRKDE